MSSVDGVNSEVFTWKKNTAMAAVSIIGITALVVGILFLNGYIGKLPPVGMHPAAIPLIASGGALLGADILALIILSVLACTRGNVEESKKGDLQNKTPQEETSVNVTGLTESEKAYGSSDLL